MSRFLDSFERFKNGEANDDESAFVSDEISKYTAIEEYLAEEFEREMPSAKEIPDADAGKRIARKVRFRIIGTVLAALMVIAALIAGAAYVCDNYYYNPNAGIAERYVGDGQLFIDMWAFNELHSPEYTPVRAGAWRESPGSYQLRISLANLFTGKTEIATERVVRGKAMSNDGRTLNGYWRFPMGNAFGYREGHMGWIDEDGVTHRSPMEELLQGQKDELALLPPSAKASVYVSFEQNLSAEEFALLYDNWVGKLHFLYAAVEGRAGQIPTTVGFSPDGGGMVMENAPAEYPYLQLSDHYDEIEGDSANVWERHFRDTLNYLMGRTQFMETLAAVNGISPQYYSEVLEYIDQNGMQIYGALVSGSTDEVLSFLENENLFDFYVNDVMLSGLSRG